MAKSKKRGPEADDREAKKQQPNNDRQPVEVDVVIEKVDTKKGLFIRVWSDEDEVLLLEGVIQFKEKNGVDPSKDMAAFYDFVKPSLHFDVTQPQVKDKLFRLKKRFENRSKRNTTSLANYHEEKSFELSQKIWGSVDQCNGNDKLDEKEKRVFQKEELLRYDDFGKQMIERRDVMGEYILRKGMEMLDDSKKDEVGKRLTEVNKVLVWAVLKRCQLLEELGHVLLASYSED